MNHSPMQTVSNPERKRIEAVWRNEWPHALAAWSRFTKLSEPRWMTTAQAQKEGVSGSFACIRLVDHAIFINVQQIHEENLHSFGREILAHEIGHHVYAPGDINDDARLLARIRRGLPSQETMAPQISNLYTDLLINDRLQRQNNLDMAQIYRHLNARSSVPPADQSRLWTLYMRIYEILWSLPKNDLTTAKISASLDVDAGLGARLIRAYAGDWMRGGGRFAMLCLPYLLEDEKKQRENMLKLRGWHDTKGAGAGAIPDGLVDIEDDEISGAIHPAEDPELSGIAADVPGESDAKTVEGKSGGQCREPFEYGEILRAMGLKLSDHDIAVRYYRERARPHLIRFPTQKMPNSTDTIPEGFAPWELGEPLEQIDWLQSTVASPLIVPGLTTLQRVWGDSPGRAESVEPIDLDLYVDCSGSMPNPQRDTSFLTLAGAIIVLSALRVGSRVQATLWSGKNDFQTTNGFTRDENEILKILTGYIGGATAFPIHLLRDTFQPRTPSDRAAHILILSDDGVTTLFDKDEKGNSGWDISRMALAQARGGATMALNLYINWEQIAALVRAKGEGWDIYKIGEWSELLEFARAFARRHYEK